MEILQIDKRAIEREAAYLAALDWIDQLEPPTEQRYHKLTRNLHRTDGMQLIELDEVIQAALAGELITEAKCTQ